MRYSRGHSAATIRRVSAMLQLQRPRHDTGTSCTPCLHSVWSRDAPPSQRRPFSAVSAGVVQQCARCHGLPPDDVQSHHTDGERLERVRLVLCGGGS
jgi:hypothetical protein